VFWSRRRHRTPPAPQGSTPEDVERARREAQRAREQLHRVEAQAPQAESAAETLTRLRRENNIGPRFWAALGQRRA
jgi:hypothetical protein